MRWMFTFLLVAVWGVSDGQSVGIGTSSPNSSAQLDISSSSRGLLIPRMTTAAISAIGSPAQGLMVYDTTKNQLMVNMGTATAPSWQTIVANSGWSLTGNAGTNPPTQFIGTVDGKPLIFGVNNRIAGTIDSVYNNVALGYRAGEASVSQSMGTNNTAIGGYALQVSTGYNNTAVGHAALQNNTSNGNVAVGEGALYSNTSGSGNTAVGAGAAATNTTGADVTAFGYDALNKNTTGINLVGLGVAALELNTTGYDNTGVGQFALPVNTTGFYNSAFGQAALNSNVTGWANTALGVGALGYTSNSAYNTAVGYNAGALNDNGYNNVFLGANTDVNADGYYNVIAIGQEVICTGSDQARFGNSATNSIGGYAGWTNFSDGRYKRNIRENVKGLDFIMRLRPITYNLDVTGIRVHLGQKPPLDEVTRKSIVSREAEVFSGFVAQEVEQAASSAGYDFNGVDKPKNDKDFYGLRYGEFVVPLVKAVQEQQKMIEELQKEVAELKKQIKH